MPAECVGHNSQQCHTSKQQRMQQQCCNVNLSIQQMAHCTATHQRAECVQGAGGQLRQLCSASRAHTIITASIPGQRKGVTDTCEQPWREKQHLKPNTNWALRVKQSRSSPALALPHRLRLAAELKSLLHPHRAQAQPWSSASHSVLM